MCDSPCGVEMSLVARESLVRFPHIMVFNEGVVDAVDVACQLGGVEEGDDFWFAPPRRVCLKSYP